jgi:hypothetical protein
MDKANKQTTQRYDTLRMSLQCKKNAVQFFAVCKSIHPTTFATPPINTKELFNEQ